MAHTKAEFLPVVECDSVAVLNTRMDEMITGGMPVFLMRNGSLGGVYSPPDVRHRALCRMITDALERTLHVAWVGQHYKEDVRTAYSTSNGVTWTGELHRAPDIVENTTIRPTLKTILHGAGRIFLATAGTDLEALKNVSRYTYDGAHPDALLLGGLVDPELMSEKVYNAKLSVGDSCVFLDRGPGAVWRHFDINPEQGMHTAETNFQPGPPCIPMK